MALTKQQMISLGFKPSKRGGGLGRYKKYDTLIYPINDTDFLYIGYNQFTKQVNNKVLWKSFKGEDGRVTYPVISLGETSYTELQAFLKRSKDSVAYRAIPETSEEAEAPMAYPEGSAIRDIEPAVDRESLMKINPTIDRMINGEDNTTLDSPELNG